jgi:hypothetical protein
VEATMMMTTGFTSGSVATAIDAAVGVVALLVVFGRHVRQPWARQVDWLLALADADPSGIGQLGAAWMRSAPPDIAPNRRSRVPELHAPCPN